MKQTASLLPRPFQSSGRWGRHDPCMADSGPGNQGPRTQLLPDEAVASHTHPSSVLSSRQLGSLVLRERLKHEFFWSPSDGKGFSSLPVEFPKLNSGPLTPPGTLCSAGEERRRGRHVLISGYVASLIPLPATFFLLLLASLLPLIIQALAETSPSPGDLPDCPF